MKKVSKMRKFIFKADLTFQAKNLNSAFIKLAKHFREMTRSDPSEENTLEFIGHMELKPADGEPNGLGLGDNDPSNRHGGCLPDNETWRVW